MHPDRLYAESQSNNKKNVKIVLIVGTKEKADRLIKNGLNFRNIRKLVSYFWETDPRAICYKYCGTGHEKPEAYGDRPLIYEICEKDHHTNNHTYNVITYKSKKRRKYLHDLIKYRNYISMG